MWSCYTKMINMYDPAWVLVFISNKFWMSLVPWQIESNQPFAPADARLPVILCAPSELCGPRNSVEVMRVLEAWQQG